MQWAPSIGKPKAASFRNAVSLNALRPAKRPVAPHVVPRRRYCAPAPFMCSGAPEEDKFVTWRCSEDFDALYLYKLFLASKLVQVGKAACSFLM